jgi:4'-phosphopantetheinyl transferase
MTMEYSTNELGWGFPPAGLTLFDNTIHVWLAWLDTAVPDLGSVASMLSPDELQRAERLRSNQDRRRFIVRRAFLRAILARYLGERPEVVSFCYGPHGKPQVLEPHHQRSLHFSLSQSHELALYAVGRDRRIGVDVERLWRIPEIGQLVRQTFSPHEQAVFGSLAPGQREEAFFSGWTRKEAYVKACGKGLSQQLNRISVTLLPEEPTRLLTIDGDRREAERLSLRALPLPSGYVGALVVEGHDWRLSCWRYPESHRG